MSVEIAEESQPQLKVGYNFSRVSFEQTPNRQSPEDTPIVRLGCLSAFSGTFP